MLFRSGVREQRLVESMYRIAMSEDPKTANAAAKAGEFLLKVWNRDKFGDKQRIEQTITESQQIQVVHTVRDQFRAERAEAIQRLRELRERTLEG